MGPCLNFYPFPTASADLGASLYVYYRVDPARLATARRAVMDLIEDIRSTSGISGRLARRLDDPTTWMEIYQPVADIDRFRRILESQAHIHQLHLLLAAGSSRNVEIFLDDVLEPPNPDEPQCA